MSRTFALLMDREQVDSVVKHLLNATDHPLVQTVILVGSDDSQVESFFSDMEGWHKQGDDAPPMPELDYVYAGPVFVTGIAADVETAIPLLGLKPEGEEGEDDGSGP